ncbi:MAG: protein kinase [Gemmatimonadales bacterium]|nr:protein kinase [Gemmatimonadales bacterium]
MSLDLRDQLQSALGQSYAFERELGGGGMSRVFLARETALGRTVVVKVLPPELAAGVNIARFAREIRLAAGLQHPHIVPLLSAGEAVGLPWFTMPYIAGESLRGRLARSGEFPVSEATRVLREIASALAYAHEHGIVHRDIKPENVLLSGGTAVVSDFGVAKALSSAATPDGTHGTSAGIALGTPAYMSPEQAAADPAVDHRADLYALGIVAYELLTGQPPFAGRSPQALLAAHALEAPEPIGRRRAGLSDPLATLVMRCLEKRPADRPQSAAEIVQALDAIGTPSGSVAVARSGSRSRRNRAIAIGAAVLAVIAGVVLAFSGRAAPATTPAPSLTPVPSATAPASPASLAVLPFVNVGGDPKEEYFSDGMTDELTSGLSKVAGLRVASRTSAFAFKGQEIDVREIGRRLNVGTVLEGTVRRAGTRLRMTVQLTSASDGLALWSERYEREVQDVFAVQYDIATAIVTALRAPLGGVPRPVVIQPRAIDLEAHDLYLRANFFYEKKTEAGLRRSLELYNAALARDPGYAVAWTGISQAWAWLADDWVAPRKAYPQAKAAALNALALDSTLAEAHDALSVVELIHAWDFAAAEREIRRALALNPNFAGGFYTLADVYSVTGRGDSAVAAALRARAMSPLDPAFGVKLGQVLEYAGQITRAIEAHRQALELDSNSSLTRLHLGSALLSAARPEDALTVMSGAQPSDFSDLVRAATARADAQLGRSAEARRIVHELEREAERRYVRAEAIASIYASLGEHDAAFRWLDRAYRDRSAGLTWLKVDPKWAPIRSDRRFAALVRKVGLP